MPLPTIVIAGGAWQKASAYRSLTSALQSHGFTVETVPLPSIGSTSTHLPGLAEDTSAILHEIDQLADDNKEIILLCHSYGGVAGSCAAQNQSITTRSSQGKSGGIKAIIYMSAFMIPAGKSLLDLLEGKPLPWMDIQGDRCYAVASDVPHVAWNDIPTSRHAELTDDVTYSSAVCFVAPATYEPWNEDGLDCSYIFCTEDNALPLAMQKGMAAQLGKGARTFELKAGHCPYLSVPGEVAECVRKVAGGL